MEFAFQELVLFLLLLHSFFRSPSFSLSTSMSSHGHSHYDMLAQAAEMVNKELGFFTNESVEENDYIDDVEREIWFLNCSLDYYYSKEIYPFGTSRSVKDFNHNWINMRLDD